MEVGAYEAKTHLARLLERVQRGERVTITRRGRPIAELHPVGQRDPAALRAALARLDESRARLRGQGVRVSREDIVAAIREGRR